MSRELKGTTKRFLSDYVSLPSHISHCNRDNNLDANSLPASRDVGDTRGRARTRARTCMRTPTCNFLDSFYLLHSSHRAPARGAGGGGVNSRSARRHLHTACYEEQDTEVRCGFPCSMDVNGLEVSIST